MSIKESNVFFDLRSYLIYKNPAVLGRYENPPFSYLRPQGYPFRGIRDSSGWLQSGRADLNRGPHGPEPCALTGLSHAPIASGKWVDYTRRTTLLQD